MKKQFFFLLLSLSLTLVGSAQKLLEAVDAKDYKGVETLLKSGEDATAVNEKGMFALWLAVWNQDPKMVELLLKAGGNALQRFKGEQGDISLLDVAAQEGPVDVVRLLVNAGEDANQRNAHGYTPLRTAARNGQTEIVKYLLTRNVDIDTKADDGATPLEHACTKGHSDIVRLLVEKGANMNLQDKDGDFALGEAAKSGFYDIVVYLLGKGADVSLKNAEGRTAEEMAKLAGQPKIQALLKKKKGA